MNNSLSLFGGSADDNLPQSLRRQFQRQEAELAASAQLANEQDIAQAMLARASLARFTGLTRDARQALDEDPLNVEALEILRAYRDGAVRRIERFGR